MLGGLYNSCLAVVSFTSWSASYGKGAVKNRRNPVRFAAGSKIGLEKVCMRQGDRMMAIKKVRKSFLSLLSFPFRCRPGSGRKTRHRLPVSNRIISGLSGREFQVHPELKQMNKKSWESKKGKKVIPLSLSSISFLTVYLITNHTCIHKQSSFVSCLLFLQQS